MRNERARGVKRFDPTLRVAWRQRASAEQTVSSRHQPRRDVTVDRFQVQDGRSDDLPKRSTAQNCTLVSFILRCKAFRRVPLPISARSRPMHAQTTVVTRSTFYIYTYLVVAVFTGVPREQVVPARIFTPRRRRPRLRSSLTPGRRAQFKITGSTRRQSTEKLLVGGRRALTTSAVTRSATYKYKYKYVYIFFLMYYITALLTNY